MTERRSDSPKSFCQFRARGQNMPFFYLLFFKLAWNNKSCDLRGLAVLHAHGLKAGCPGNYGA